MSTLEAAVATALRLSTKAAEKLKPEIERKIETARLDLIRVGVPEVVVKGKNELVEDAIICFCLAKMGPEEQREQQMEAYLYQADSLRRHVWPKEES